MDEYWEDSQLLDEYGSQPISYHGSQGSQELFPDDREVHSIPSSMESQDFQLSEEIAQHAEMVDALGESQSSLVTTDSA